MSYAIRKDGLGWRAINDESEVSDDEVYSETQPDPIVVKPDYSALRSAAYRNESDPIYFQEMRGEVPKGTWVAKVEEIRKRYPDN